MGELLAREKWRVVVAALFAALLARETWRYELTWQSDEILWRHAMQVEPKAPFPPLALAAELAQQRRLEDAAELAEHARGLGGGPLALVTVARIAIAQGKTAHALYSLGLAYDLSEYDPTIGALYLRLLVQQRPRDLERERAYVAHIEKNAALSTAHRARAYLAQAESDLTRAEREYLAAENELDQDDWLTLAAIERKLGRDDLAQLAVRRALAMDSSLRARLATDTLLGPLLR